MTITVSNKQVRLGLALSGGGFRAAGFILASDSELGQAREGDAAFASAIGTNLKKLGRAELDVLARHAGALLAHRLQTYTPGLLAT